MLKAAHVRLTKRISELVHGLAYGLGYRRTGGEVREKLEVFLFATTSKPTMVPSQPSIQQVSVVLSSGVKRPEGDADHLLPSDAEC
jgi:hypothetical protein